MFLLYIKVRDGGCGLRSDGVVSIHLVKLLVLSVSRLNEG